MRNICTFIYYNYIAGYIFLIQLYGSRIFYVKFGENRVLFPLGFAIIK